MKSHYKITTLAMEGLVTRNRWFWDVYSWHNIEDPVYTILPATGISFPHLAAPPTCSLCPLGTKLSDRLRSEGSLLEQSSLLLKKIAL